MLTLDGQPTARPTTATPLRWFRRRSPSPSHCGSRLPPLPLSLSPLQSGVDALVMVVLARPVAWWSAAISTWELLLELEERERESMNAAAVLDHFQTACC